MRSAISAARGPISWHPRDGVLVEDRVHFTFPPCQRRIQLVAQLAVTALHADGDGELERHGCQLCRRLCFTYLQVAGTREGPRGRPPHHAGVELAASDGIDDA